MSKTKRENRMAGKGKELRGRRKPRKLMTALGKILAELKANSADMKEHSSCQRARMMC
jgi:hypothetical protein